MTHFETPQSLLISFLTLPRRSTFAKGRSRWSCQPCAFNKTCWRTWHLEMPTRPTKIPTCTSKWWDRIEGPGIVDAVSFWFVWHTFVVHPYTLTQQRLTTLTQPEATLVQHNRHGLLLLLLGLLERPLEWIALVAHHIQHTVSTHVQRLYPLIVTGFLQSKHLHTFPFDKFVWARHSTGVKLFTGPASLENMDCYAKIKSYKKYSNRDVTHLRTLKVTHLRT